MAVKKLKRGLIKVSTTAADGSKLGPWQMPRSCTVRKIKHKVRSHSGTRFIALFTSEGVELVDTQVLGQIANSLPTL
jgi:hypothetical protein